MYKNSRWQPSSVTNWGVLSPQAVSFRHIPTPTLYANSPELVTYGAIPIYQFISNEIVPTEPPTTTYASQPRLPKDNEPTTPSTVFEKTPKPEKLVTNAQQRHQSQPIRISKDLKIIRAIQERNRSRFSIQSIRLVPGQRLRIRPSRLRVAPLRQKKFARVVTTAMGSTSVDKPVVRASDVFDYFVPNNSNGDASLILEPSARAVAGNDGTAISAPLSRAFIRPGTTTRILFRPDSVAIAGPGGRAHAHADLIVDYLSS